VKVSDDTKFLLPKETNKSQLKLVGFFQHVLKSKRVAFLKLNALTGMSKN